MTHPRRTDPIVVHALIHNPQFEEYGGEDDTRQFFSGFFSAIQDIDDSVAQTRSQPGRVGRTSGAGGAGSPSWIDFSRSGSGSASRKPITLGNHPLGRNVRIWYHTRGDASAQHRCAPPASVSDSVISAPEDSDHEPGSTIVPAADPGCRRTGGVGYINGPKRHRRRGSAGLPTTSSSVPPSARPPGGGADRTAENRVDGAPQERPELPRPGPHDRRRRRAGSAQRDAAARRVSSIRPQRVAPFFVGKDARELEPLLWELYRHGDNYKFQGLALWVCVAAAEFAVLDLLGKKTGKSIGDLLGGVKRREIAVYRASGIRGNTPRPRSRT